jgi:hypothetical protein
MGFEGAIETARTAVTEPEQDALLWMPRVLTRYAEAEQALGRLSLHMGYPVTNGSLGHLGAVKTGLHAKGDRPSRALSGRIDRWLLNRPYRHLLAHATVRVLHDGHGARYVATRHLPRAADDVTPDRLWSDEDRRRLLHDITRDSRSICDQVRNLLDAPPRPAPAAP